MGNMGKKEKQDNVAQGADVLEPLPCNRAGATPPNKYSDAIRDEALRLAVTEGLGLVGAAKRLGVADDTIGGWLREMGDEVRLREWERDIALAESLGQRAALLAQGISPDKVARAGVRDIAIAMGIALDKRRSLLGAGPGTAKIRMRVAWQDGSGAVELTTDGQE